MPKKTVKKGKKVVKKKVAKKPVKKIAKNVVKKVVKKAPASKKICSTCSVSVEKPFGKSQIAEAISNMVGLSKKDAALSIDALFTIIGSHLKKRGPGEFTLPGVAKFRVVHKPATKARHGINPFTGQPMVFAAKPARNTVKVRPLKKIKDLAK